jgi:hypothetical protein
MPLRGEKARKRERYKRGIPEAEYLAAEIEMDSIR